jgi:hypothetical protein
MVQCYIELVRHPIGELMHLCMGVRLKDTVVAVINMTGELNSYGRLYA